MDTGVICLRPPNRRPVRLRSPLWQEDVQASVPAGWCEGCGKEVYEFGGLLCRRCEKEEENHER